MSRRPDQLLRALRDPDALAGFSPSDYERLLHQARSADLLGRVATWLEDRPQLAGVPAGFRATMDGVRRKCRTHEASVARERRFLADALRGAGVPLVLLKGAAYQAAGLPAARGRLFSDVDILVPRALLPEVESGLMMHGWLTTHDNAYDQRYYRLWMHELPPMVHMRRQSAVDVHHTISPPVSRWPVDGAELLRAARPVPGDPDWLVLAPTDMVLHSVLHLLINEELSHGLRDLSDIDLLLRHFAAADAAFWAALVQRAEQLGIPRALHYGLCLAKDVLYTPVPDAALQATRAAAGVWGRAVLLAAWRSVLSAPHAGMGRWRPAIARFVLYVRGTWIRMPPLMLARHLWIKAWRSLDRPRPSDVA